MLRESQDESELLEMIERGDLDLTFWTLPVAAGPYETVELLADPVCARRPGGSPLASLKRTPTLKEIVLQPLIGFNHCSAMDHVESHLASTGRAPNIVFRSDNNGTVQGLVGAGVGLSVSPRLTVDEDDPSDRRDRPPRTNPAIASSASSGTRTGTAARRLRRSSSRRSPCVASSPSSPQRRDPRERLGHAVLARLESRITRVALGDVQLAFAQAAAEDGIVLGSRSFDWLCEQGHVGLERVAKARRDPALVGPVTAALEQLGAIYARLKGDVSVLYASRENLLLPVDLVHEPTGTVIEVDESPHFTSFRLTTLELYPADAARGVRPRRAQGAVPRLVLEDRRRSSRGLAAKGFGFGGVQRERAYHDALRDLATPAMGHPPVVRIAAVDGDGAAAYRRHRASLLALRAS